METASGNELALKKTAASLEEFREHHRKRGGKGQFDIDIMQRVRVIEATMASTVLCEIELDDRYSNIMGTVHGAAVAIILDMFTTTALAPLVPSAVPGAARFDVPGGITRALNLTYLRPIALPATLRVYCEVVQHGRAASLAKGAIRSMDGKMTFATCEHHKMPFPGGGGGGEAKRVGDSKV